MSPVPDPTDDVLGGGPDDAFDGDADRPPLPGALRVVGLAVVVVAAIVALTQSGLLSAGDGRPSPDRPTPGPGGRLVALADGHLVVADGDGWTDGPELPEGLGSAADLVPVILPSGRSLLLGVVHRTLFRVDPREDGEVREIGRAAGVVGSTGRLGTVVVERLGGDIVEVDVQTGATAEARPFPGYDPAAGWRPEGLAVVGTGRSLLVSRAAPGGEQLGLAAAARPALLGTQPALRLLPTVPRLLGLSPDAILAAGEGCPGPTCQVLALTVTRDEVLSRPVAPPADWDFLLRGTGRSQQGLLPVRGSDGSTIALARSVAGGASALLVGDSAGVVLGAGLVDDLDGTVFMLVATTAGSPSVWAWRPGSPARLERVRDAPPSGAELACACG